MALVVKNPPASAGDIRDAGSIPGSGRSPGGGHGNPLQYACLKNPMNRGAWWATVHRVSWSQTWLKWLSTHAHMFTICVQVSPLSKFCPGVWNPIRNVHFNSLSCFLNFYIECLCSFSLAVYLLKDSNSTVFPIVCIFLPAFLCTCFFSGLFILKLVVRTEGMIRFRFKFNNFCFWGIKIIL